MNWQGPELGRKTGTTLSHAPDRAEDDAARKPPRDWKRSVLIFGLGALSWVATYVGMLELIEANMGDLPLVHRVIIGFSVAMLMTMIIWLLDQLFKPHTFLTKLSYAGGYIFLSLISIGFGFGFYWKVLESRGESSRSAESAVSQVQNALHGASTRLEQLQATLVQLTQVSTDKAELERTKGTSCPNSKPGDGPRRKMREEDAQRFSFASEFVKGRVGAVKGDMEALERRPRQDRLGRRFDVRSQDRHPQRIHARARPQARPDGDGLQCVSHRSAACARSAPISPTAPSARRSVATARTPPYRAPIRSCRWRCAASSKPSTSSPSLQKPEIAAVEGSEATIEAFRRLTTTFYGLLSFKMPPTADELRELQKKAIQSVENPPDAEVRANRALNDEQSAGLSKRDYVPLAVALFVDLCLFLVSMAQRPAGRLEGLVPKMKAAERGPVIEILSRFNEIHRDKQVRENFELFRHVVFDMNGEYYVAVPLDAPPHTNPAEREDLRVEAQLLANLFSSFEREKIFKRTLLPTTGSIRKRLRRQGSKFAGSESFRVYKFTNGAWSDIILGAVMGAARRAEARQGEIRDDRDPDLTTPPNRVPPDRPIGPEPAATLFERRTSPARPSLAIDPEHATRFGPYAETYRPDPPPPPHFSAPQTPRFPRTPAAPPSADVAAKAANSNTAQTAPIAPPFPDLRATATVVAIPRPSQPRPQNGVEYAGQSERDETLASVTLQRETATFTVPVSEAVIPDSLKAALTGSERPWARAFAARQKIETAETGPAREDGLAGDDAPHAGQDQLSAEDRAFIRRIAPPAAE